MFIRLLCLLLQIVFSDQKCLHETTFNGFTVEWPESQDEVVVTSSPMCIGFNQEVVTRFCNNSQWTPPQAETPSCYKIITDFNVNSCPPGYETITKNNSDYCYQVTEAESWNYPCFQSGGALILTELSDFEINSVLNSLANKEEYRYWLPAHRNKVFNPLVWTIPGQNWGRRVIGNNVLPLEESLFTNCLVLDVRERKIISELCYKKYPSLCFYINELQYPAVCPPGYHAFRFMPHKGTCYGIDYSNKILGSTFDEFISKDCINPMGDNDNEQRNLLKFIFVKIAEISGLPNYEWCWFDSAYTDNGTHLYTQTNEVATINSSIITEVAIAMLQGMINSDGVLALMNVNSRLQCIACEKDITYLDPQVILEYNEIDQKMYLTIYHPKGLWRDNLSDKGIRCFSDAEGFVEVIDIDDQPFINVTVSSNASLEEEIIEKIVYFIYPVTDRSAQYWCEGHLQNFSLLQTKKIVVSPKTINEHVFSLVIEFQSSPINKGVFPDLSEVLANLSDIFDANKVLLMDFLNYTNTKMVTLLHLHVNVDDSDKDLDSALATKYGELYDIAMTELPKLQITFLNMSSCTHCMRITTRDATNLDWELTRIGQITAPLQFCLQENGLPVKRRCGGSYLLGSKWEPVDGICSKNYIASDKTTYLYRTAKGEIPLNSTSAFMTDGLSYVLNDLDIIIPADIFYLSMSFEYIIEIANQNDSIVDMGDIHNIVWAMDRVMNLDWSYLRLAQTLNSSNVILDSVDNIVENIIRNDYFNTWARSTLFNDYQVSVRPDFLLQISYPHYNNITGLALIKQNNSSRLTDMLLMPLYKNTSVEQILNIQNLEIATWVSNELISSLKKSNNESTTVNDSEIHMIISIFNNDAVFQQIDTPKFKVNGRILSVSIPGYISNLEHPITLIFKDDNTLSETQTQICGYWNFESQTLESSPGFWANEGCFFVRNWEGNNICQCYHLTHFGKLISFNRYFEPEQLFPAENRNLNIITLIGCFLSLLGITGIWVTAIVFRSWRQKAGTKVLLQLSTAISIPLILILIFNLDIGIFQKVDGVYVFKDNMKPLCIFLGAFLHYSILASFMWMLITAVLQFIRYVRVLGVQRPSRFMIKFTLLGWGVPMIPVFLTITINSDTYVPTGSWLEKPLCYPTGYSFIFAVILPIASILVVNVVLFLFVMYSIAHGPDGKLRRADMDLIGAQFRLSIILFFLLGLTWIFGLFSFSENGFSAYLFVLSSTLQGFLLFIYFVICDPATRSLWITLMKPQFKNSPSRESITSISFK